MALRFKHEDKIFLVEGNINNTTIKQFKNHLEFLLLYCQSLTINLDRVKAIEDSGIQVLKDIYSASLACNKKFVVTGNNHKKIYDEFRSIHSS